MLLCAFKQSFEALNFVIFRCMCEISNHRWKIFFVILHEMLEYAQSLSEWISPSDVQLVVVDDKHNYHTFALTQSFINSYWVWYVNLRAICVLESGCIAYIFVTYLFYSTIITLKSSINLQRINPFSLWLLLVSDFEFFIRLSRGHYLMSIVVLIWWYLCVCVYVCVIRFIIYLWSY
jgi:hypothetical protein